MRCAEGQERGVHVRTKACCQAFWSHRSVQKGALLCLAHGASVRRGVKRRQRVPDMADGVERTILIVRC